MRWHNGLYGIRERGTLTVICGSRTTPVPTSVGATVMPDAVLESLCSKLTKGGFEADRRKLRQQGVADTARLLALFGFPGKVDDSEQEVISTLDSEELKLIRTTFTYDTPSLPRVLTHHFVSFYNSGLLFKVSFCDGRLGGLTVIDLPQVYANALLPLAVPIECALAQPFECGVDWFAKRTK